jgi:hypothetical protein
MLMSAQEFNLTSIREAEKSTTLNRSIKRLTWITVSYVVLCTIQGHAFSIGLQLVNIQRVCHLLHN